MKWLKRNIVINLLPIITSKSTINFLTESFWSSNGIEIFGHSKSTILIIHSKSKINISGFAVKNWLKLLFFFLLFFVYCCSFYAKPKSTQLSSLLNKVTVEGKKIQMIVGVEVFVRQCNSSTAKPVWMELYPYSGI